MKAVRIFTKLVTFFYCLVRFHSIQLAYYLAFFNVSLINIQRISRKGKRIQFNGAENKNQIFISQLPQFKFSINILCDLLNNANVMVTESFPDKCMVSVNGLNFQITSLSNMAVLYEVFVQEIYAIDLQAENLLVIDIGMNVGVASQYFASLKNVKAVYGYEPFLETFLEAQNNLELNETIKDKVFCNNYGVSDKTENRMIYLYESGLLSASTIEDPLNTYGKDLTKKVEVKLKSFKDIMDEILPKYPESSVLLKIDCEGEEYAIFESIKDSNYLDKVVGVLVEWHVKGKEPITSVLKNKGFQFLSIPHETENCGMIYAFRN